MRKIIPSGVVECQIGPRRSVRFLLAAKIKKHKQISACAFLAEKERLEMPLRNIVALLAWSTSHCSLFLHLTASLHLPQAALRRFAPRRPGARFSSLFPQKKKAQAEICLCFFGGEGETRTLAPVTRPTPLAGAPRHQLEYFSMMAALMLLYEI